MISFSELLKSSSLYFLIRTVSTVIQAKRYGLVTFFYYSYFINNKTRGIVYAPYKNAPLHITTLSIMSLH